MNCCWWIWSLAGPELDRGEVRSAPTAESPALFAAVSWDFDHMVGIDEVQSCTGHQTPVKACLISSWIAHFWRLFQIYNSKSQNPQVNNACLYVRSGFVFYISWCYFADSTFVFNTTGSAGHFAISHYLCVSPVTPGCDSPAQIRVSSWLLYFNRCLLPQ